MKYTRYHHQAIGDILDRFDPCFLGKNTILFGGGTRIALELHEFRESVDIDLFCVGKSAYRAARSAVTSDSFGPLLRPGHTLQRLNDREIRADRDAIRALLEGPDRPIKLEIIHFANDRLVPDQRNDLFPIPFISREGCFATKLTANADRYRDHRKDILDLCMMRREWGNIPEAAWRIACDEYGEQVIAGNLENALVLLTTQQQASITHATQSLQMHHELAVELVQTLAPAWLNELA
jgi:hypothetical protein